MPETIGCPFNSIQRLQLGAEAQLSRRDAKGTPAVASHTRSQAKVGLGGIELQDGCRFLQAVVQRFQQVLHRPEHVIQKHRSHALPQPTFTAQFGPHRLEQGATKLLGLIDEKRQHHQHGKHHREVLVAMAKVVLKVIPLVFQRVERLILYTPAGSPAPHDLVHPTFKGVWR